MGSFIIRLNLCNYLVLDKHKIYTQFTASRLTRSHFKFACGDALDTILERETDRRIMGEFFPYFLLFRWRACWRFFFFVWRNGSESFVALIVWGLTICMTHPDCRVCATNRIRISVNFISIFCWWLFQDECVGAFSTTRILLIRSYEKSTRGKAKSSASAKRKAKVATYLRANFTKNYYVWFYLFMSFYMAHL